MKVSKAASQQILQFLSQFGGESIKVGDTITGRIVFVEDGLLLMQLPDGSRINAQVQSDAKYSAGDILKLEVMEEKQGQYFVREVVHNPINSLSNKEKENPEILLKLMNLPVDKTRLEIVKAILDMGARPVPDIVEKSNHIITGKHVTDPKQAVFLAFNEMGNKEEYFPMVKQLKEGSFHFREKWLNLTNQLKQLDNNTINHIAREFMIQEAFQELDLPAAEKQIQQLINYGQNHSESVIIPEKSNVIVFLKDILPELITLPEETVSGEHQEENSLKLAKQYLEGWEKLSKPQRDEVVLFFKNFLRQVKEKSGVNDQMLIEAKTSEVSKYVEKIMTAVSSKISVKSSDAFIPKVDEWTEDIEKKLMIIKEAVVRYAGTESQNLLPVVRELETALRFFQDIISYETFVQIPLVLKESTYQGELYVMKRKRKRGRIDIEDFSLFLSITTQNLGVMDIFVHVRNKNVMLRVMMENETFYELVTPEYKPLYEALKLKGFYLYDLKYSLRDEGIDILNASKKAADMAPEQNSKIDFKI